MKRYSSIYSWLLLLPLTACLPQGSGVLKETKRISLKNGGTSDNNQGTDDGGTVESGPEGADPFTAQAWHLKNTGQTAYSSSAGVAGVDINVETVFKEGVQGNGVQIFVSDDGIEGNHEDLFNNLRKGFARDYTKTGSYDANWVTLSDGTFSDGEAYHDDHGTSVAGLIAAEAMNSRGSRGVAPKAKLNIGNLLSGTVLKNGGPALDMMVDQISHTSDITNQSWGTPQDRLDYAETAYVDQMRQATTTGRSNKGMLIVKSAGNSFAVEVASNVYRFGNVSFDGYNTTPYTINVAAVNAQGKHASYSSFGSGVWVSAPGGEYGDTSPAMITTDRTGCANGHAKTSATSNAFDRGGSSNSNCTYTASFNGTSSAAPVTSGVIALILEANPTLTWRDVKHILASTSKRLEPTATRYNYPDTNVTFPNNLIWEQGWVENKAGFVFNNIYGFGMVDATAAVRYASLYSMNLGTQKESSWLSSATGNTAIPDNNVTGITSTINVTSSLTIEAIQIQVDATHTEIGQLAVELTSPQGTKNIILNANNALYDLQNYGGSANLFTFLSNAFYGEKANGTWTIRLIDPFAQKTGTFRNWKIKVIGRD